MPVQNVPRFMQELPAFVMHFRTYFKAEDAQEEHF